MSRLNKEAYEVIKDGLVYDYYRLIDAKNVTVKLSEEKAGVLKRGQLIDFDNGEYSKHSASGTANCIVAEDTEYTEKDTGVVATVYTSGDFTTAKVISESEITETDKENLRSKNIVLK